MSEDFAISDELAGLVNGAFGSGKPILIGYVNADQVARLSFRGSVHVHSGDQLALWARDPEGGLLRALPSNPNLTLMYRDPETRTTIFFYGKAHAESDAALRDSVYAAIPEPEQKADPERKGSPVIVDVHQIQGRTADGPVNLSR